MLIDKDIALAHIENQQLTAEIDGIKYKAIKRLDFRNYLMDTFKLTTEQANTQILLCTKRKAIITFETKAQTKMLGIKA